MFQTSSVSCFISHPPPSGLGPLVIIRLLVARPCRPIVVSPFRWRTRRRALRDWHIRVSFCASVPSPAVGGPSRQVVLERLPPQACHWWVVRLGTIVPCGSPGWQWWLSRLACQRQGAPPPQGTPRNFTPLLGPEGPARAHTAL